MVRITCAARAHRMRTDFSNHKMKSTTIHKYCYTSNYLVTIIQIVFYHRLNAI